MNKFSSSLLFLSLISFACLSQTVTVKKQSEKVKNESADGAGAELDGKTSEVSTQWSKFLKDLGKVKLFSSDPLVITEPVFNGTIYKGTLYAYTFDNGGKARVWLGYLAKEWEEKELDFIAKQTERLVYQFGVQFYRSQVQNQIDETTQATQAVEKQKQRLINQNKELTLQLANNEQEKIQLEKSIQANQLEHEALKIKIEKNKKAQDSLINTSLQIKKVMETHKERLRKIN
jgi:hypothetical protein